MAKYLFLILFLTAATSSFGQNGFPNYWKMVALNNKADSLYKAKQYKEAAQFYNATAAITVEKAIEMNYSDLYYNAACSWALANVTDSAFAELNKVVSKLNYSNYQHLIRDPDLNSLHGDSRWEPLCATLKAKEQAQQQFDKTIKDRTTYQGDSKEVIFYPHTEQMRKFIDNDSLPFLSTDYLNFRIYFRGNSYAGQHLSEIKHQLDSAFVRILSVVNTTQYYRGLNLIMVDSAGEMQELTGMYVHGGFSLQRNDEIFFVCSAGHIGLKHEIFHFISNDLWGPNAKSRLLNEGGAVYTEHTCDNEYSIYNIDAYLLREKQLFSFQQLIDDFHEKEKISEEIAYFESAGIFKYLYEKYGVEKMKQLWQSGFDGFQAIYNMPLSEFERQWKEFISTIQAPKHIDLKNLGEGGC